MGLPLGAAKQACVRDGKDPSIMDLDPDKSFASQTGGSNTGTVVDNGPPLRDDPEYAKVCLTFCFNKILNMLSRYKLHYKVLENAKNGITTRCSETGVCARWERSFNNGLRSG